MEEGEKIAGAAERVNIIDTMDGEGEAEGARTYKEGGTEGAAVAIAIAWMAKEAKGGPWELVGEGQLELDINMIACFIAQRLKGDLDFLRWPNPLAPLLCFLLVEIGDDTSGVTLTTSSSPASEARGGSTLASG